MYRMPHVPKQDESILFEVGLVNSSMKRMFGTLWELRPAPAIK